MRLMQCIPVKYIYASNSAGTGPSTTITVTTGTSDTSPYLPFITMGARHSWSNEVSFPALLDGASSAINIPISFPFGSSVQTTVYVSTNGLISFGSPYIEYSNTAFPDTSGRYNMAPFWDDVDISGGGRGAISYETFESGYFLEQVNAFLQRKRPTSFEGTWMLVAYYNEVFPYFGTGENTFQAILITDRTYSYTIFSYKCGLMEWDNGATIGFSAAGSPYANHDPSSSAVACVNTPESDWSNAVYLLSSASPEDPAPLPLPPSPGRCYVDYGTDEDVLGQSSGTVLSSDDTSLTNQNYSVSLSGLSLNTTYYIQVVATFGIYILKSDISSFTTPEGDPNECEDEDICGPYGECVDLPIRYYCNCQICYYFYEDTGQCETLSVVLDQPLMFPIKDVQGGEGCYPEDTAQDRMEIEKQIHQILQEGLAAAGLIGSASSHDI